MQLSTTRFGEIEVAEDQVVTFAEGLPGFESARKFVFLSQSDGSGGALRWMQCIDGPRSAGIAFPVVSPWRIDEQYTPTIPGSVLRELAIDDVREQAQFWAIVTVPRDRPEELTVNLLAPVMVNRKSGLAKQVVLVSDESALRTPLARSMRADSRIYPAAEPDVESASSGRAAAVAGG